MAGDGGVRFEFVGCSVKDDSFSTPSESSSRRSQGHRPGAFRVTGSQAVDQTGSCCPEESWLASAEAVVSKNHGSPAPTARAEAQSSQVAIRTQGLTGEARGSLVCESDGASGMRDGTTNVSGYKPRLGSRARGVCSSAPVKTPTHQRQEKAEAQGTGTGERLFLLLLGVLLLIYYRHGPSSPVTSGPWLV